MALRASTISSPIFGKRSITFDNAVFNESHIRGYLTTRARSEIDPGLLRPAGVLVPFLREDDELKLVLTLRTDEVEHHKGQISFPGGVMDAADRSIVETALREAEEEIGLPRDRVRVLGLFDDLATPSGFSITPVVGYIERLPALNAHPAEVAEILKVPVSFFLDTTYHSEEIRERMGILQPVHRYLYGHHDIWGATAAIIHGLLRGLGVHGEE